MNVSSLLRRNRPKSRARATFLCLLLGSGLATSGCTIYGRVPEQPVAQSLPAMPEPSWPVGTTWHFLEKSKPLDSGTAVWWRVAENSSETLTIVDNGGCTANRVDLFSPALLVKDCRSSGTDSTQVVERQGDPWPLQVGKSWRYTASDKKTYFSGGEVFGSLDTGNRVLSRSKSLESECRVESEVRVEISAGAFDTYKVVCTYRKLKKTWYISPSLEGVVMHIVDPDSWETRQYERIELDTAD